ncbi:Werner Syndrome-like exonuclease [Panicum virgatum]|uniref:Werner Syndrome-like exonuclease n=1 Tax=Panicum virgatum TaxID=38727 RepID=UPI0019D544B1|nr:Werner Syndrome-like exonuclease [Panicum virgatum]
MIVGLDTEWKRLDDDACMMALLQLCVRTRVLVFQVLYAACCDLPEVLKRFLTKEDHIFTGAHIENDVKRLRDDFGITISNPIDLQLVVPEAASRFKYLCGPHPKYRVRHSSLEKIATEVLRLPHLKKPGGVDYNNWDTKYLHRLQVEYAAVDAYLSYEIAKQLEIMEDFKFV